MTHSETKEQSVEKFKAALRRHGMKATPQRLLVHETMLELGHASADMVWEAIRRKEEVKITVASVYNVLEKLASIGIYHHRLSSNSKMYYDVNTYPHIHLYDCENNTFRDIVDDELMGVIGRKLDKKRYRGYHIEDVDIQIVCRPTKKKYRIMH